MTRSLLAALMAYENNQLNYDEMLELFQRLVDSGLAWTLQGSYGRMAKELIEQGLLHPKG